MFDIFLCNNVLINFKIFLTKCSFIFHFFSDTLWTKFSITTTAKRQFFSRLVENLQYHRVGLPRGLGLDLPNTLEPCVFIWNIVFMVKVNRKGKKKHFYDEMSCGFEYQSILNYWEVCYEVMYCTLVTVRTSIRLLSINSLWFKEALSAAMS